MLSPLVQLLASITVDRIKDPRKFIVGVDALELEDARAKAKKDRKEYDYKVKQNGDKAVATNLIDGVKTSLVKTAKGWLIDDPWYGIAIRDELGTIDVPTGSKNILVRKLHSQLPNSWAYRVYLPTETPYQIEVYQNTGAKLVFNDGKDSIEPMSVDPGQFTIGIGVAESLVKPNDISVESFGVFIDGRSKAINFQRSDIKFLETKLGAYENFGFHLTDFPHHNEEVESFAPGDSITLLHVKAPSDPARLIDGKPAEIIIRLIPRRTDSAEPKGVRSPIDPAKTDDTAANNTFEPSPPVFDTPEALMKYVADCQNREDVAGYLSCLTDEPVKQLASGYFLASISMLQEFANDPNTHRPPNYAERMKELEQFVREAVSDKDMAPSALAFATASGRMRLESNMQDPLLQLLAHFTVDRIKDPRRFIVRFNAIVIGDERSKVERVRKEFDYLVEQDGDKAVATNKSDGDTMGLIKTAYGWRINDPWYGIKTKDDLGAVPATTPTQVADSDPQSLEFATKSYNEQTAELRRSLFQPPIPDLSIEQMREGLRKAVDDYQQRGKHQVANALQKIAETGRLPDGILLFATGVHAEDGRGGTLTRQIVPGLILPDNTSQGGHLLTPIQPLGLLYRKDGKCSKTYGDSDWNTLPAVEKPASDSSPSDETSDLLRKLEGSWTIESIYTPQSNTEVIPDYAYKDVYVFEKNKVRIEREAVTVVAGSVELKNNPGLTLTMQFDNKVDSNGRSESHIEGALEFKSNDEFWLAVPDTSVRPSQEAVLAGQPRVVWKMRRVVAASPPVGTRKPSNLVKHYARQQSINIVAVAPDGKTMAIPSRELADFNSWPTVSIVDVSTGETIRTISPASDEERNLIEQSKRTNALSVTALAYSPDGKKLAIGTSFGQVDIVNPETGERILTLDDNLDGETSSGTKRLRPTDQGTDDESVRALARLKDLKRAMGSITSIAFTSDGLWLATSGASFEDQPLEFDYTGPLPDPKTTGRVKVWNAESGKRKFDFDHHLSAGSIAFSRSTGASSDYFNCILATAGSWRTGNQRFSGVRLWRMGDGNLVQELRNEDEDFPSSIAYSPDSVLLAIGRKHKTNANGETCGIVRMVKPLAGVVWEQTVPISARRVVFVAKGNMLAVLCGRPGQEQSIQLLDANTGKLKRELKLADLSHGGAWLDFAYSASEQLLIAVGSDKQQRGSIDVWDFESRRGKD